MGRWGSMKGRKRTCADAGHSGTWEAEVVMMWGRVLVEEAVRAHVRIPDRWRGSVEITASDVVSALHRLGDLSSISAVAFLHATPAKGVDTVRSLRATLPRAVLWAVGTPSPAPARIALAALARAGLDDWYPLSMAGEEERLLDDIRRRARISPRVLPCPRWAYDAHKDARLTHAIVTFCVRNVDRRLRAEDVATWFGEHRRSVDRWLLRRTGASTASWLKGSRQHFGASLRSGGIAFAEAARLLGYANTSGAQMLLQRARDVARIENIAPLSQAVVAREGEVAQYDSAGDPRSERQDGERR